MAAGAHDQAMSSLLLSFVVGGSALGYHCFNRVLNRLPGRAGWLGPCGKYSDKERHKWRNAATSLLNSFILACLVCICFYRHPTLWSDMQYFSAPLVDATFASLLGYYLYDLYDLVAFNKFSAIWPLIGHHVMGMVILTGVLNYREGMGVVLVALFCEVNAVFLHLRQILLMHGVSRQSRLFRTVKVVNVTTFASFRLFPMIFSGYRAMTYDLPALLAYVPPISAAVILSVNVVLYRRIIYNDFIRQDNNNASDDFVMDR